MKQIKTLILDDEPAAVTLIGQLATEFTSDLEVKAVTCNGLTALQTILDHKPQLIFLDIDMPLLNGLQILQQLDSKSFLTIITTGSSEYALNALKLGAIDYLLKPIDPAEFIVAVNKARERLELMSDRNQNNSNKIQLPIQNEIIFIDEINISYITGMGSYCQIFTTDNQKLTISKSIGSLEQKLSEENFFRCHNSHIVNLDHIQKIVSKDGFFAIMKNGVPVEISRRNKEKLMEKISLKLKKD